MIEIGFAERAKLCERMKAASKFHTGQAYRLPQLLEQLRQSVSR